MAVPGYAVELATLGFSCGSMGYRDGLMYIRDIATQAIKVYNFMGVLKKTITTAGPLVPVGISVMDDGSLIIFHNTDKKLYKITADGVTIAVSNALSGPTGGMGVANDKMVFVNTSGFVYLYSVDWSTFTTYLLATYNVGAYGTTPRGCDFVNGDKIVVMFDDSSTVTIFTLSGVFIKSFSSPVNAAGNAIDIKHVDDTDRYVITASSAGKLYTTPVNQPT